MASASKTVDRLLDLHGRTFSAEHVAALVRCDLNDDYGRLDD